MRVVHNYAGWLRLVQENWPRMNAGDTDRAGGRGNALSFHIICAGVDTSGPFCSSGKGNFWEEAEAREDEVGRAGEVFDVEAVAEAGGRGRACGRPMTRPKGCLGHAGSRQQFRWKAQ